MALSFAHLLAVVKLLSVIQFSVSGRDSKEMNKTMTVPHSPRTEEVSS